MLSNINYLSQQKEEKYFIPKYMLPELIITCSKNMRSISEQYYNICSTYFDNEQFSCYSNHIVKITPRFMLRFRQYGANNGYSTKGFLEIKGNNIFPTRRRLWIYQEWLDKLSNPDVKDGIISLNKEIKGNSLEATYRLIIDFISKYLLNPIVQIDYKRYSFESIDKDLLITFDTNVHFYSIISSDHLPQKNVGMLSDGFLIMKMKSNTILPEWIKKILNNKEVYPHTFTKYALAITSLYKPSCFNNRNETHNKIDILKQEVDFLMPK